MQCYYRVAVIARRMARELAIPNLRPGSVDVPSFCDSVRSQWAEIKALHREITRQPTKVMEQCASTMGYGFSLARLVTLRMACPRMLFLQHQQIQVQLDSRRHLASQISSAGNLHAGHVGWKSCKFRVWTCSCRTAECIFTCLKWVGSPSPGLSADGQQVILPTGILQSRFEETRAS